MKTQNNYENTKQLVIGQIQHKLENTIHIMYKIAKVDDEKKNQVWPQMSPNTLDSTLFRTVV